MNWFIENTYLYMLLIKFEAVRSIIKNMQQV